MKLFSLKKRIILVKYKDGSEGQVVILEDSIFKSLIDKLSSNSFMFIVIPFSILKGILFSIYFNIKKKLKYK